MSRTEMPPPEPVTVTAPRPVRWPVLVQGWHDLTFLHWPVDPAVVAPLLPPGTRPDTFDGTSYVGLIGFRMVGVGFGPGPGIPYLGTFCETNVRLYSVDDAGRRGVVFRSLDAARLLPVLVAMAILRLPYLWSRMRLDRAHSGLCTGLSWSTWPTTWSPPAGCRHRRARR